MRSIWKFQLAIADHQRIDIPEGGIVRMVATQFNRPCLWTEVDTDAPAVSRGFRTYGTGQPMDDEPQTYLGSYPVDDGNFVFHVYEQAVTDV